MLQFEQYVVETNSKSLRCNCQNLIVTTGEKADTSSNTWTSPIMSHSKTRTPIVFQTDWYYGRDLTKQNIMYISTHSFKKIDLTLRD